MEGWRRSANLERVGGRHLQTVWGLEGLNRGGSTYSLRGYVLLVVMARRVVRGVHASETGSGVLSEETSTLACERYSAAVYHMALAVWKRASPTALERVRFR